MLNFLLTMQKSRNRNSQNPEIETPEIRKLKLSESCDVCPFRYFGIRDFMSWNAITFPSFDF
jgi:hypothetical protein